MHGWTKRAGVLSVLSVLLGLLVAGPATSATPDCITLPTGDAGVDLDDSGDVVVFRMRDGVVYVNGVSCGRPRSFGIQDAGEVSDDRIVIDASEPFPGGSVQLNLRSFGSNDVITILGAKTRDVVTLAGSHLQIVPPNWDGTLDTRRLSINLPLGADVRIKLRGGNDRFRMLLSNRQFAQDATTGKLTVRGGRGNDHLSGGPADDRFFGGPGRDKLRGKGGNDLLRGGSGRDIIRGGSGNDTIVSGKGADNVRGGKGVDTCKCGASDTTSSVN